MSEKVIRVFQLGVENFYDVKGLRHNEDDSPAVVNIGTETKEWWKHGKMHRTGGPALTSPLNEVWYLDDRIHRLDGPAFIDKAVDPVIQVPDLVQRRGE